MLLNDISMGEQGHAAEGEFLLLCVVLPIKMPNVHFMDGFAVENPPKQARIIVSAPLFTTAGPALGLSPVFLSIRLSCCNA